MALTLEGLNAVEAECLGTQWEDFTRTRLDVNISTRASRSSLDSLTSLVTARLDVAVSTRASQSSLDAFHTAFANNATVVNDKLDSVAITIGDQGTLALRIEIESELSEPPGYSPVALFMLPTSSGSKLELVREIVVDTIAKMAAVGEAVEPANHHLAKGDEAGAAGDFKEAYGRQGKAYRVIAGADGLTVSGGLMEQTSDMKRPRWVRGRFRITGP